MAHYLVKISSGKKGTAAEHSRYDARVGKYEERGDLISVTYENMPEWARDKPLKLWCAADKYERKNAAAFLEAVIALPKELGVEENLTLASEIADIVAPGLPRQTAIHQPESSLEGIPNPHMHLMFTARKPDGIDRSPERFFARYNPAHPERGGCRKERGGNTKREMGERLVEMRWKIADKINEALANAGSDTRVDHRSNVARGIDRASERHLGPGRIRRMTSDERQAFVAARKSEGGENQERGGGVTPAGE